ncbi:hypothetical protein QR680_015820 [Steinernema hermaphroditum]|uniref:Uncharacterized protein n=1 Tax=Steinernema hermaphroditum TaxID=289476 RepID=A0AA39H923_9BILA|nr:hypothetical protein QR680_015820 [Steinernema hermaphroditum]
MKTVVLFSLLLVATVFAQGDIGETAGNLLTGVGGFVAPSSYGSSGGLPDAGASDGNVGASGSGGGIAIGI